MLKNNVEANVKVKCIEENVTRAKPVEDIGVFVPYVSQQIRNNERIVNKTFLRLMDQLGYDVELTYKKNNNVEGEFILWAKRCTNL